MNLITAAWLPVRYRSQATAVISPLQITELHNNSPIVSLDFPRPDFNGAIMQFLIGLLQSTTSVQHDGEWEKLLGSPPTQTDLQQWFAPIEHAFELTGDGPRFMQDAALKGEPGKPVSALFIDAPGEQSLKNNTDHFIKRGSINQLDLASAAAALFCLQTNAPAGGAGYRTGLRGGGPLTTLIVDGSDQPTLWKNLWLNVLNRRDFLQDEYGNAEQDTDADRFPWLAPTRTSEKKTGRDTYSEHVHPDQLYWAMPRRVWLDMDNLAAGQCDVSAQPSEHLITQFAAKNYGVSYNGAWQHPLSPHSKNKDGLLLPLHPNPGGMTYRHWLGLVLGGADNQVQSASVVAAFNNRRPPGQFRLHVFGYDMDNMKARCWYEATMPLYHIAAEQQQNLADMVQQFIAAAEQAAFYLRIAIKNAWYREGATVSGDLTFTNTAFLQNTEAVFYQSMQQWAAQLNTHGDDLNKAQAIKRAWAEHLQQQALALFDLWAASGSLQDGRPQRIGQAQKNLKKQLYGPKLREKILGLPTPEKNQTTTKESSA